jgi:hypothetical protein
MSPYPRRHEEANRKSAFVGQLPSDNQAVSVADQLDAGIRFLQAQVRGITSG